MKRIMVFSQQHHRAGWAQYVAHSFWDKEDPSIVYYAHRACSFIGIEDGWQRSAIWVCGQGVHSMVVV